eukprot:13983652-Alexandrium_andersonii.AAC.1
MGSTSRTNLREGVPTRPHREPRMGQLRWLGGFGHRLPWSPLGGSAALSAAGPSDPHDIANPSTDCAKWPTPLALQTASCPPVAQAHAEAAQWNPTPRSCAPRTANGTCAQQPGPGPTKSTQNKRRGRGARQRCEMLALATALLRWPLLAPRQLANQTAGNRGDAHHASSPTAISTTPTVRKTHQYQLHAAPSRQRALHDDRVDERSQNKPSAWDPDGSH